MNPQKTLVFFFLSLILIAGNAAAQKPAKAADYKITNIKIVPYNGQTGEFETEIGPKDERAFFNDLEIGLFVIVEISGQRDSFEAGRKIDVMVMEGKKLKLHKLEQVGYMGDNAKVFYPVWLPPAMCSEVTITARLVGQKTISKITRKVPFMCGE